MGVGGNTAFDEGREAVDKDRRRINVVAIAPHDQVESVQRDETSQFL